MDISRRILFQSGSYFSRFHFKFPISRSRILRESFSEWHSRDANRNKIIIATIVDDVWCIGELERGMPMRQLEISTRSIHFRPDENEEDPADSKATKVRFSCPLFRRRCNVVLETLGWSNRGGGGGKRGPSVGLSIRIDRIYLPSRDNVSIRKWMIFDVCPVSISAGRKTEGNRWSVCRLIS